MEEKAVDRQERVDDSTGLQHYVGIGASAGGLEAIETFFKNMPIESGLAFIVVQHLSPDYKSLMGELLSKHTEMPIYRAKNSLKVEANSIYLIPPKKNLTIFHGKLILTEQDHSRGVNLPIDIFLRSLAEDQGEKAIAVIMSGTGSDGTRGVRAVKEAGGMVMVQSEESSKFDGMPRSAISTGVADFVLNPEEMPGQLMSFSRHPYAAKSKISESLLGDDDGLTRLFALLRERHKIDFTYYKPSTVVRRIERRMTVNQIQDLRSYVKFMESYPREISNLYRELLIGVTSFFRDRDAFEKIAETWLPQLLEKPSENQVRFWVPGCSTGEEAYTLAILCQEVMKNMSNPPDVKIFATDIDNDAILRAASGVYPESITADLTPNLLGRYFFKHEDGHFHISRKIREMVVFAVQNLIKDPPFTNISLVSCRNLMIYLQPVLQRKVLELINFSLVPDGILFLGTSETIGDMTDYFESVDHRWKVYRSKGRHNRGAPRVGLGAAFETAASKQFSRVGKSRIYQQQEEERVLDRVLQAIAENYFTCAFVVNDSGELIHILGNADGYLKFPAGKIRNDISKIAVKELSIPLSTGIQRTLKNRRDEQYSRIRLQKDGKSLAVNLKLSPLPEKRNQESMVLIIINEVQEEEKRPDPSTDTYDLGMTDTYDLGMEAEQRILDLEQELQYTRENLQATIEELETSNEELQATNEELLASNEELQSTNEELQSVNEELFTVNTEYQAKIMELTEANNNVSNLLSSSDEAKLFLDENLDIRIFTPNLANIFNIIQSDLGRPFNHVSNKLQNPDLQADIDSVQKTGKTVRREVRTENGSSYYMRILPYYTSDEVTAGVVLTFTDISDLKKAQGDLRAQVDAFNSSEEKHRILFEMMTLGVVYQGVDGKILDANPAACDVLGLSLDQIRGRTSMDSRWKSIHENGADFSGETHPAMIALKTGKPVRNTIMGVYHPEKQEHRWININAIPKFRHGEDKPFEVFATFDDITDLKRGEEKYRRLFKTMIHGFAYHQIVTDDGGNPVDYIFLEVNDTFEQITGLKRSDLINRRVTEALPGIANDSADWINTFGKVAQTGESIRFRQYSEALGRELHLSAYSPIEGYFAVIIENVD